MNFENKYLVAVVISGSLLLQNEIFAEATITAEKNCSVRLEGETYEPGEQVAVFKEIKGKKRKVAMIEISKSSGKKAVAKVIAGQKHCGKLVGATLDAPGKNSGSSSGKSLLPRIDASVDVGYLLMSTVGLHQKVGTVVPTLALWGFGFGIDAYPLLFTGKGFIHKALGLGIKFGIGSALKDIDVNSPDGDPAKAGKQATSPTNFQLDFIVRIPYLNDKMTTEIRPIGYITHSITHKLTIGNDLTRSPLRNVAYQGFGLGVKQRWWTPVPNLRVNLGISLPVALNMLADNTTEASEIERQTEIVKGSGGSGLLFDLSADYQIKIFKISAGYHLERFSGTVTLQDETALKISEMYNYIFVGGGILF